MFFSQTRNIFQQRSVPVHVFLTESHSEKTASACIGSAANSCLLVRLTRDQQTMQPPSKLSYAVYVEFCIWVKSVS